MRFSPSGFVRSSDMTSWCSVRDPARGRSMQDQVAMKRRMAAVSVMQGKCNSLEVVGDLVEMQRRGEAAA
jgi:hypothetical protein